MATDRRELEGRESAEHQNDRCVVNLVTQGKECRAADGV